MRKTGYFASCAFAVQLCVISVCNAQNLKAAPAGVVIDGDAKEWLDLTPYSNGDAGINYAISNDKDNVYLAVKTQNLLQQNSILNNGITFSVDVKGRKRSTYNITFPMKGDGERNNIVMDKMQILSKIEANKSKKIKVEGFKDVKNEEIAYTNTSNIKIAMGYDNEGNLVYEEAIPLTLFNAGEQIDKQWAFNIKINGSAGQDDVRSFSRTVVVSTVRAGSGGSPSGGGYSTSGLPGASNSSMVTSRPGNDYSNRSVTPVIDFWVKGNLAKP